MTASADSLIRLWDVEHQTCVATLKGHEHSIRSVNFHPVNPREFPIINCIIYIIKTTVIYI